MKWASVCSGIGAPEVAWGDIFGPPAFQAEIEAFPSAVLAHRFPGVPNLGDFTEIGAEHGPVDLLVGGTPCQSFSVAGKRLGLDDPRGNLALEFLALARRLRARWIVFENVPGLLSNDEGRDFGTLLGTVEKCGYGWAYRVADAQFAGVPQRRRRVFLVGYLGDWRPAAAVLLEPESLRGDSPPRREAGEGTAHDVAPSIGASGRGFERAGETRGQDPVVAHCLSSSNQRIDAETETLIAHSLRADGFDMPDGWAVRRLLPVECERLQGLPDGWTNIPWRGKPTAPDGPRYKAIGNSMAVPVVRRIGQDIALFESLEVAA